MASTVAMMTSPDATSPSALTSCGGWKSSAGAGGVPKAAASAALVVTGGGASAPVAVGKDSGWLTLEVCREFARQRCGRSDAECRYAHPPPHVDVQNGRVVCCFDSIKGRCQRSDPPCKYLHPPQHLKEQLLQNGRNNLLLKSYQRVHCLPPTAAFIPMISPYLVATGSGCYAPYYRPATAAQSQVVIPSSAPALTEAMPTVAPTSVTQPCPQPEEVSVNEAAYTNNVSPQTAVAAAAAAATGGGGCHYWTVAPPLFAGSPAPSAQPSAAQFCPAPIYYQNGGCCAIMMPKNSATATPAPGGKNNMAVYSYNAPVPEAFQQMTMPMNGHYPVAIAVPSSVGGFYGC